MEKRVLVSHRFIKLFLLGLVATMFVCFGVAVLRGELHFYREGNKSRSWPTTNGVVVQSRIQIDADSSSRPFIEYRYQVESRTYLSSRIRFGNTSGANVANQLATTYHLGKEVKVFYDPLDASSAILEPGVEPTTYVGFAGGPILILAGLFLGRWLVLELRQPGSVMTV